MNNIEILLFSLLIVNTVAITTISMSDAAIPPTRAFSKIMTDNGEINARSYSDWLDMRGNDAVNVTMSGNNVHFWMVGNASSGGTNSFGTLKVNGVLYKATAPNQTITINTQGSVSCTLSGGTVTCKLSTLSCPALQGIKGVDSSGNLFCGLI